MRIDRRRFLIAATSAAATAGLAGRLPLWAQQEGGAFTPLRRNVGIFDAPRSGGTIGWYIGKDAVAVVDSKGPQFAEACVAGIRERTELPIDVLINSHHHGDHTGGNGVFKDAVGSIVAHENVPGLQRAAAKQRDTLDAQVYPDKTYSKTWSMDLGDEKVTLTHLGAAHTGGDSIIHFEKAGVIHMGDLIFNHWCPFIDIDGGASTKGWIKTLTKVYNDHVNKDTIFIFGHGHEDFGVTGGAEFILVQRDYLQWVWDITSKGVKKGASPEEIAEPGLPEQFGKHLELGERLSVLGNVKAAYAELTAKKQG